MEYTKIKKDWFYLITIIILLLIGTTYYFYDLYRVTKYNLKVKIQTLEMYYFDKYEKDYTSYGALAMVYCSKDIILIDIKDRKYYEALESFNHEWLHCQRPEHYPDRLIIENKD